MKEKVARHSGYVGGQAGVPILRRTDPEYNEYETGYFQGGVYAGYDRVMINPERLRWLLEGSLRTQLDYYYLGGDEGNLGSHKHQYSLLGGWKQRFNPFVTWNGQAPYWLFVDPMMGLGVADNELNFGRGFPLEQETSLNFLARLGGGVEYCFHANACLAVKAGYDLERSLAGLGYLQRGWRAGPELEANFFGPPIQRRDPCWEDLSDLRENLTVCEQGLKKVYSELTAIHGEIQGLLAINARLREATANQIDQYKNECKDPGIVPPDFEAEIDPLGPPPHWQWADMECPFQLEAAEQALEECRASSLNEIRDRLAAKLVQAREVHQQLVGQLEETIHWIYECRKPVRTPKSILLFANDNAVIFTQPQEFFDRPLGKINPDLDDWIVFLNHSDNKKRRLRIHGYSNDTGDAERNRILSQERSDNVKRYLTKIKTGLGETFGPTLVPAGAVPPSERKKGQCIEKAPGAGLAETYCTIHVDPNRIEKAKGYGSDPAEIATLRDRLKRADIDLTEADPKHPIYRMVWLELSDEEGDF